MTIQRSLYSRVDVPPASKTERTPRRSYRGFSTVSEETDNFTLYDFELIKQDFINHLHIRQGEKLSDPAFGTIIWDLLFEPFTDEVQAAVVRNITEIANYDPRVNATNIVLDTYEHGILLECTLTFLPYNIADTLRFRFDQRNGLL